jgi:DNA-binding IclR family transcriptional regulator
MTERIAEILDVLGDGEWHTLRDVQQKTSLSRNQIQRLIEFLKEYGFVKVDETERRLRLDETVQELLMQTSTS